MIDHASDNLTSYRVAYSILSGFNKDIDEELLDKFAKVVDILIADKDKADHLITLVTIFDKLTFNHTEKE